MKRFNALSLSLALVLIFSASFLPTSSQAQSQPATKPVTQPTVQPATKPASQPTTQKSVRDLRAHSNVDKRGVAIEGYDPVAYFDGKPMKGKESLTVQHQGVMYRFSSAENKAKFVANPEKYAPAYGGWCAYAMVDGEKVEVDPKTYRIVDGRLFLYYNGTWGNTLKAWNKKDEKQQTQSADSHWKKEIK
jgi:YHS domain-containing protein